MKRISADKLAEQRRREKRVHTRLPVLVNGKEGFTRDISATGVFFEMDDSAEEGSNIQFHIELDTPGGKLKLVCDAQVVRVTKDGGRSGVAAKILSQSLEALSGVAAKN